MKTIRFTLHLLLFSLTSIYSQELKFNDKGYGEITMSIPNKNVNEIYEDIKNFVSQYYLMTKYISKDDEQTEFTLEVHHFDSFNRLIFPKRRPLLDQQYNITYKAIENGFTLKFQHLKFLTDELEYYLSFPDLINGVSNPLIYKDDKAGMLKSLSGIAESLKYYIDNKEMRY